MNYHQFWNEIPKKNSEMTSLYSSYWKQYSNFETWQFWVVIAILLIPLILLIFTVDRKRIFEIFFFGYTVHFIWTYLDISLGRTGYFYHTYFLTPFIPNAINITASILPVGFLLVYQYCTNKQKNFYLYTVLLSAIFSFGFASVEKYLGFVEFRKGMNQLHLFLLDLVVVFSAYWFTKIIIKLKGT